MRRYLDPGKPPWKSIADLWLEEPYPAGRGTILAAIIGDLYTDIPPKAKYLRACVKEFETIKLIQDTSILEANVQLLAGLEKSEIWRVRTVSLNPCPTRDPAVGAVQAVGALRGPLRLPPGVPGTDFWLPGTV